MFTLDVLGKLDAHSSCVLSCCYHTIISVRHLKTTWYLRTGMVFLVVTLRYLLIFASCLLWGVSWLRSCYIMTEIFWCLVSLPSCPVTFRSVWSAGASWVIVVVFCCGCVYLNLEILCRNRSVCSLEKYFLEFLFSLMDGVWSYFCCPVPLLLFTATSDSLP